VTLLTLGTGTVATAQATVAREGVDPTEELSPELISPQQVEPISAAQFGQLLKHHRGDVVVVNLWATWCIPCLHELPDFDLAQQRYAERGLRILGVSIDTLDRLEERVRPFFAERAPNLVSYLQTEADEYTFIDTIDPNWAGTLPTTYFFDRQGNLRETRYGRLLYRELEVKALELLDEEPPSRPQSPGS
jgi:thiol-disulfide isomerase/thioredoxin